MKHLQKIDCLKDSSCWYRCDDLREDVKILHHALSQLYNALDSCCELTPEVMITARKALEFI